MSNGVIYVHTWDGELLYSSLPGDVCKWKNHREYLLLKRLLERLNCPQDKPVYENPHGSWWKGGFYGKNEFRTNGLNT